MFDYINIHFYYHKQIFGLSGACRIDTLKRHVGLPNTLLCNRIGHSNFVRNQDWCIHYDFNNTTQHLHCLNGEWHLDKDNVIAKGVKNSVIGKLFLSKIQLL